jgi:hypothetical protein
MPKSFYKGEPLGKRPPCLVCAGAGDGPRALLHLTHGVSLWLCAGHRAPEFLRKRAGRDFVLTIGQMWSAAGIASTRRHKALSDHLRRVAQPGSTSRPRPGSYAWPHVREEAEKRFAAGEAPRDVISEIHARHQGGPAPGPSIRTLYRWFNDGRWLGFAMGALARAAQAAAARARAAAAARAPARPARAQTRAPAQPAHHEDPHHRGPPRAGSLSPALPSPHGTGEDSRTAAAKRERMDLRETTDR